jgi:tetratricopeptide (TPR) repeat protein
MVQQKKIRLNFNDMKKLVLGLFLIGSYFVTNAQGKYGATPQDSVKCIEALAIYPDYIKNDLPTAKKYWRVAYTKCPASRKSLYTNGVDIYEAEIKKNKDNKELVNAFVDTILMIYDQRIVHFGQEGYVLGRKGMDMMKYRPNEPYKAFEVLDKSMDLEGNDADPGVLYFYMRSIIESEEKGKKTKEDVLNAFGKTLEIAEYNINNGEDKKKENYKKAIDGIIASTSKYLDCETLLPIAKEKYEANKDNAAWLRRMAKFLKRKDCTDNPEFSKIAIRLFELEPSADAADNLAKMFLAKKDYGQSVKYFQQAIDLSKAGTDQQADYYLGLAFAQASQGSKAAARTSALKAASLRDGFGEPYMLIADMYASSASSCGEDACSQGLVYCLAVDTYQKARSVSNDENIKSKASAKIASYSGYFPKQEDCFFIGIKENTSYNIGCWINASTTVRFKK